MPTNLLADEILTPGEGQVRALIVIVGNPALSFPDQEKIEAMFSSAAYAAILPARDKGFASIDICFAEEL